MQNITSFLTNSFLMLAAVGLLRLSLLAPQRYWIELTLERNEGRAWFEIDSRQILNLDDRIRFRLKTNFDGYLYVTTRSTSGKYDVLFPGPETGRQNRIEAAQDYVVPQTASWFRVTNPPGQEIVYFLVSPVELGTLLLPPKKLPNADTSVHASTLVPRCDDGILKARGHCLDLSAGPRSVNDGATLPGDLSGIGTFLSRDLVVTQQQNTSVISSNQPLRAPIIYEVRLAHR